MRVFLGLRSKLHEIIYEADTPLGKLFDIVLILVILLSVLVVMLETVETINDQYSLLFQRIEWGITIFFTIEYILRIVSVRKPWRYIFSFYGIIDLISTIPLYLSYVIAGSHLLVTLRSLRLLRVFRILKLVKFIGEASRLRSALRNSREKIMVFVMSIVIFSVILGTIMYLVEGQENGFSSIPRSIYWTIVTMTTVGYGDIAPQTTLGQIIASIIMVLGYGIIAVPTGIVTAEYAQAESQPLRTDRDVHLNTQACPNCSTEGHRDDARHCHQCGSPL